MQYFFGRFDAISSDNLSFTSVNLMLAECTLLVLVTVRYPEFIDDLVPKLASTFLSGGGLGGAAGGGGAGGAPGSGTTGGVIVSTAGSIEDEKDDKDILRRK